MYNNPGQIVDNKCRVFLVRVDPVPTLVLYGVSGVNVKKKFVAILA